MSAPISRREVRARKVTPRVARRDRNRHRSTPTASPRWTAPARSIIAAAACLGLIATASLPAFATHDPRIPATLPGAAEPQTFGTDTHVTPQTVDRSPYATSTAAELLASRWTSTAPPYQVTWTGPVRWPFPVAVPISDGFGWRASPCSGCSSNHKGVDLLGGDGRPIYAVADGVVRVRNEAGGFGNHAYIESEIDGQQIQVLYAHMKTGSSPLQAGDRVAVGTYVGLVGGTGQVTGPHLHLELAVDGLKVDPFAWIISRAR